MQRVPEMTNSAGIILQPPRQPTGMLQTSVREIRDQQVAPAWDRTAFHGFAGSRSPFFLGDIPHYRELTR
jgi:hypothetical protein